uniref:Small ribosomal subunit protein mS23 conserved domain-containing protein n=1 Tax=Timema tahoe TaxID=61484 RepID=A0A7R9FMQ0_9NEOP|nr:unnamed protein product [Timema tahoe]
MGCIRIVQLWAVALIRIIESCIGNHVIKCRSVQIVTKNAYAYFTRPWIQGWKPHIVETALSGLGAEVTGLLRSGAMKQEDKPLWYHIYESFPPKYEPSKLLKVKKNLGSINLLDQHTPTSTQKFLNIYNKLKADGQVDEDRLFDESLEIFNNENKFSQSREETFQERTDPLKKQSLASTFRDAQNNIDSPEKHNIDSPENVSVNIKDIFK